MYRVVHTKQTERMKIMKTNLTIVTLLIGITITIAMNLGTALQYYGMI